MATTKGRIKAISISKLRGTKKYNVPHAWLEINLGIVSDAHSGNWHRQVSLLAAESINKMIAKGAKVGPGDFAENITTKGINLSRLVVGTRLKIGKDAEIEITQIGKQCHQRCEIFEQNNDCIMPREGLFAKVIKTGRIKVGQTVEILNGNSCNTDN